MGDELSCGPRIGVLARRRRHCFGRLRINRFSKATVSRGCSTNRIWPNPRITSSFALGILQRGDQPDYEGLLDLFPQNYHEPYYASYTKEDFSELAANCGLSCVRNTKAFVSKVMVFDKPAAKARQRTANGIESHQADGLEGD